MSIDNLPDKLRDFWLRFDPQREREAAYYDAFQVGFDPALADAGARHILDGSKRTTSSLLWEYEQTGRLPPTVGALSILLDGRFAPLCIIETTAVEVLPFDGVDEAFCKAYAESDGTKEGWLALNWSIYSAQCANWGRAPSMVMPLVCEWFNIAWPTDALGLRRAMRSVTQRTAR